MKYLIMSGLLMLSLLACQSNESANARLAPVSELAATMRVMTTDMEGLKTAVAKGELTLSQVDAMIVAHASLATDQATTPSDIKITFPTFADGYIKQLQFLRDQVINQADVKQQIDAFNAVLVTCVGCHQDHCPGPIERIEKIAIQP